MDILYQLPFPQEICSKIFCYACKSPHTGLGIGVLKHFAYIDKDNICLQAAPDGDALSQNEAVIPR